MNQTNQLNNKMWLLDWDNSQGKWINLFDINYCSSLREFTRIQNPHQKDLFDFSEPSLVTEPADNYIKATLAKPLPLPFLKI